MKGCKTEIMMLLTTKQQGKALPGPGQRKMGKSSRVVTTRAGLNRKSRHRRDRGDPILRPRLRFIDRGWRQNLVLGVFYPLFSTLLPPTLPARLYWVTARGNELYLAALPSRRGQDGHGRRRASPGPAHNRRPGEGAPRQLVCRAEPPPGKRPFPGFPRGNCSTREDAKSCTSYLLWVGRSLNAGRSLPFETRRGLGAKVSSLALARPKAGKEAALRWTRLYLWWGLTSLKHALAVLHHAHVYQLCLTGPLIPRVSPSHSEKVITRIY